MSPLPTAKTAVVTDPSKTRFYIYGAPGIGKTTLASKFRRQNADGTWAEPLFLCTEEGVGFIEVFKAPIGNWGEFKAILKELAEKDPEAKVYSTVVVDTIDLLFIMCEKFVCEAKGIAHPSDLEWGKGWSALRDEFQVVLSYLSRMKQGLVLIGHAKVWEKKERGVAITCVQPTLTNTGRRVVLPIVDVILYCEGMEVIDPVTNKSVNKRIMRSEPNETVEAKDRTGRLPALMAMDYAQLEAYIAGTLKKNEPVAVPPTVEKKTEETSKT